MNDIWLAVWLAFQWAGFVGLGTGLYLLWRKVRELEGVFYYTRQTDQKEFLTQMTAMWKRVKRMEKKKND